MSSKISGLFRSRVFILSFIAVMMICVLSSAPCLELFSAAPDKEKKRPTKSDSTRGQDDGELDRKWWNGHGQNLLVKNGRNSGTRQGLWNCSYRKSISSGEQLRAQRRLIPPHICVQINRSMFCASLHWPHLSIRRMTQKDGQQRQDLL